MEDKKLNSEFDEFGSALRTIEIQTGMSVLMCNMLYEVLSEVIDIFVDMEFTDKVAAADVNEGLQAIKTLLPKVSESLRKNGSELRALHMNKFKNIRFNQTSTLE